MKMLFLTKTQDTVTNHIETVPTPKQSDSKMQTSSHNSIIATPTDSSASNTTPAVTSSPRRQDVDAKTTTAQIKKIGVWCHPINAVLHYPHNLLSVG